MFSTEGVRDAAVLTLIAVLGGGAAFAAVEKNEDLSGWDGVWWAIQTVTTVGYGDTPVTTDAGRVIAICLMVTGIGFVAVLTAAAAERFLRFGREEDMRAHDERLAIEARAREDRQAIRGTARRNHPAARFARTPAPNTVTEAGPGAGSADESHVPDLSGCFAWKKANAVDDLAQH